MIKDEFVRKAIVRKVIDGDTIEFMIDMGYRRFSVERVRVINIDAPELRGKTWREGKASKEFAEWILPVGKEVYVKSQKGDAFGRWVGEIYYFDTEGVQREFSQTMLENGQAVVYVHK